MVSEEGDELTFLKRRHMLVNEFELAIQSHPKHLEKLFGVLKLGRGLKPKKTPVHPLLDETDSSEPLDAQQASVYRSCIGILLSLCVKWLCGVSVCNTWAFSINVQTDEAFHRMPGISLYLSPRLHRPMYDAEVRKPPRTCALQSRRLYFGDFQ